MLTFPLSPELAARVLARVLVRARARELKEFDPSLHPHAPGGSPEGGRFVPTGEGGAPGSGKPTAGKVSGTHGKGRPTTADDNEYLSTPSDAVEALAQGQHAAIGHEDLRGVIDRSATYTKTIDLSRLTIDDTPVFAGGLNFVRDEMPQIPDDHRDKYIKWAEAQGIKFTYQNVDPMTLRATQSGISAQRVEKKLRQFESGKRDATRIFVSGKTDNFVIDGHHRWALTVAIKSQGGNAKQPIIRMHVPIKEALASMKQYMKLNGLKFAGLENILRLVTLRLKVLEYDPEKHPKDERGRWIDASVPAEPGTTPLAAGKIRAYHYTDDLPAVLREGLDVSHAKGASYGEPNAIWFSTAKPGNYKDFVEVHIDPSEVGIGGPALDYDRAVEPARQHAIDEYNAMGHDFLVRSKQVPPSRIVTYSQEWHSHYRYIKNHPDVLAQVLAGEHDALTTGNFAGSPEGQAILRLKKEHGRAAEYDEAAHPRDESGKWTSGGTGGDGVTHNVYVDNKLHSSHMTKASAHATGTALRRGGHSASVFPSTSPFRPDAAGPPTDGSEVRAAPVTLYHSTPDTFAEGKPGFAAFYGTQQFQAAFPQEFGAHTYALEVPPDVKILDLSKPSPAAQAFMASMGRAAWPKDTAFHDQLLKGTADPDDFYEAWTDKRNILAALAEHPQYHGVRYHDEYLLPAKTLSRLKGHLSTLGGKGSGNFGHAGRPGEVGGAAAGESAAGVSEIGVISSAGEVSTKAVTGSAEDRALTHRKVFGELYAPHQKFYFHEGEVSWDDAPSQDDFFKVGDHYAKYGDVKHFVRNFGAGGGWRPLQPSELKTAGGEGSGNFGHAGRPGEIGGSSAGGGGGKANEAAWSNLVIRIRKPDGGFTYHAVTGAEPHEGFAVSVHRDRIVVLPVEAVTVPVLAKYVRDNRDLLQSPSKYLGAWHNPDDGKVYLDISKVVDSADAAEHIARAVEPPELAYFDLKGGHSIPIVPKEPHG